MLASFNAKSFDPLGVIIGSERGMTLSSSAVRVVAATGVYSLRVSRTTASRYGRELSSSYVGWSLETATTSALNSS